MHSTTFRKSLRLRLAQTQVSRLLTTQYWVLTVAGDLGLRIGIHSGPITAGVLRGSKGRFQVRASVDEKPQTDRKSIPAVWRHGQRVQPTRIFFGAQ